MTILDDESPPAPANPFPPHLSTNNPVNVDLSWSASGGEGAERISNGGFENGDFTGWTKIPSVYGDFIINSGTNDPDSPDGLTPPFEGSFSALATSIGGGLYLMYRDVAIPTNFSTVALSWADRIRNFAGDFATNQQFRVEARTTANTTLAVLFSTQPGDPLLADWVERTVDLSRYKGQTIRLAFIVDPALYFLDVHLDNISVRAASPPPTTYDIYFGTNSIPGPGELLGSTTNNSWDLPILSARQTYFWQIVGHRLGETVGAIWQFTTGPAAISISNAGIVEGDSGTTNLLFEVHLSGASSSPASVNYATVNDIANSPSDYAATNGIVNFAPGETNKTISVRINSDLLHELNETFFLNLTNPINATLLNSQAVGTITNDDPFLTPITDKIIDEQTLLTFTAVATSPFGGAPGTNILITDFESFNSGTANGTVLFRSPRLSGSTAGFLNTTPDSSTVTSTFPGPHSGTKVLAMAWSFNTTANPWVRLTTLNPANLPNPIVDFAKSLRFDIYSDKALRVGLGLRETSSAGAIGGNGGTVGAIEFVGVPSTLGATPTPSRLVPAGSWTTLTFDIPNEPIVRFTGNGILESTTGKGVLEHLALVGAGGTGTYNVYLDNFRVVSAKTILYTLAPGAPSGASINPTTGVFSWNPTEAQGPGVYPITVRAAESEGESDEKTFTVTVNEVNSPPLLSAIADRTIHEGTMLVITNIAADSDLPANSLIFTLDPVIPAGASIGSTNGIFTWLPSASQIGSNFFTVRLTDNGTPNLANTKTFTVTVVAKPMLQVESGPGNITLTWSAIAGKTYRVQFKNDLAEVNWTDVLPDVTPTGSTAALTVTTELSQRFYRVWMAP